MNYAELVAYLDQSWSETPATGPVDHFPFGELRDLLAARGNPEMGLRVVHVTGSKGKGSVTAMAAAILRTHGVPTGAFTGPHLVHLEERIQTSTGAPIDREELAARMTDLMAASQRLGHDARSIWRLLVVAALEHFRDTGTRHAAVEVGRGGRFDATNVLDGQVACITPIGLEHVPRLGRTTAEIAAQKVGIVKRGSTCVTAPQPPDVDDVIAAGVALAGARLVRLEHEAGFDVCKLDRGGIVADLRTPHRTVKGTRIGLLGRHQAENACVALCAAEEMLAGGETALDPALVRAALAGVRWPGRLEILRDEPLLVYDGAHTAESAVVLAQALRDHFPGTRWTFVVGLRTRRDASAMMRAFASAGQRAICVPIPGFEAISPGDVAGRAQSAGLAAETADSVEMALDAAGDAPICIAGTLYLYSYALQALSTRRRQPERSLLSS